jgi:eukaryotic-like serine/threonine-protein kinase
MKPGQVVMGRYVIEAFARAGGMGSVYRARDRDGSAVAVKVLTIDKAHLAARFARETRVLMALVHPAIVRCLEAGVTDEGEHFLVMEWLEGVDLQACLLEGRLSFHETLALIGRVAGALGVAHARGMVHRDVKPGNIFLPGGDAREARLVDFGIARWIEATTLTTTGTVMGTPQYMAPEQIRGERHIDGRADVFALGCVLYECLGGEPAFSGQQVMAVFYKILVEEVPRITGVVAGVPEPLVVLLERMLAKNPASRPRHGAEVAAEIARIQDALASAEGPIVLSRALAAESITRTEQHLVSVVVVDRGFLLRQGGAGEHREGPVPEHLRSTVEVVVDSRGDTMPEPVAMPGRTAVPAVRWRYEALGARFDHLADGSLIAVLDTRRAATDQAGDAARCALGLRAEMPGRPMAVATGRAIAGQTRWLGEVIERAFELLDASRALLESSDQAPIRLDEVTAGLIESHFRIERDGRGPMLMGERQGDREPMLLGRPTPFVGRKREMAMLMVTLEACVDERMARVALITAPAGMGKSRLEREFSRWVAEHEEHIEVWRGRGEPMHARSPLRSIAQVVRQAAGIREDEPLALRHAKLRARVERHVPAEHARRVSVFLGELIKTPWSDEDDVQLSAARRDSRLMGDQMRRAYLDLLAAETRVHPVVLILEDLHWGDQATVDLLDLALRNLARSPLLIVALGRPEVHHLFPDLWARHDVLELGLRPLSERAARQLVREVLGDAVEESRAAELVKHADGNPFYLEELIRNAAAGRRELPDTVLAMVHLELQVRTSRQRRVLRAGSIFGNRLWRSGLDALLGTERGVTRTLQELADDELIWPAESSKFAGELEYRFRHDLIREAAYGMLTEEDRQLGHRLAGQWLEQVGETDALVMAEHFERGNARGQAVPFFVRAAEDALEAGDFAGALEIAKRGVACGAQGATLGVLCVVQAQAHKWRGEILPQIQRIEQAMSLLPSGHRGWYEAAAYLVGARSDCGEIDALEASARMLQSGIPDGHDRAGWILLAATLSRELSLCGKPETASRLLAWIETQQRTLEQPEAVVAAEIHVAHAALAMVLQENPATALKEWRLAELRFREAGDLRRTCAEQVNVGGREEELGLYQDAEATLRDALATAEQMALDLIANFAKINLSITRAHQGVLVGGRELAREAADSFEKHGNRRMAAESRAALAEILLLHGDMIHAESEARAALALSPEDTSAQVYAQAMLARVLLARGEQEQAQELARQAISALQRIGVYTGEAMVRLVYAEALHANGEHDRAREAILAARERLLERAAKIDVPEWRESFLRHVSDNARTLELVEKWA